MAIPFMAIPCVHAVEVYVAMYFSSYESVLQVPILLHSQDHSYIAS